MKSTRAWTRSLLKIEKCTWGDPPSVPTLSPVAVHIWFANLAELGHDPQRLTKLLSREERMRAGNITVPGARVNFVVIRAILRSIIAAYSEISPRSVDLVHTLRGKPYLRPESSRAGTQFSLSHSRDSAIFAFTENHEIGIDLEDLIPSPELRLIAARYLGDEVGFSSRASGTDNETEAFYILWTAMEAIAKAKGTGIFSELEPVWRPTPERGINPIAVAEDARRVVDGDNTYFLTHLSPMTGKLAAIAVSDANLNLEFWWLPRDFLGDP